jgi:hypothetical protein
MAILAIHEGRPVRYAIVTLLVAPVLSGCAFDTIKREMGSAVGQPVSAVVAHLGLPTEDKVIAGKKVYIWSTSNFVDGTNYRCQIRAVLGDKDIIASWDYDGNLGGCQRLAARFPFKLN